MLPKLAHASKLRIELEGWRSKVKSSSNPVLKQRINKLCDEIYHLAQNMDNWHDPAGKNMIVPNLAGDIREKILKKRQECIQLLQQSQIK